MFETIDSEPELFLFYNNGIGPLYQVDLTLKKKIIRKI